MSLAADGIELFVLLDGLGWQHLLRSDLLEGLCPFRTGVATILGYSSGAVPSILTGKSPTKTGQWAMWYYSPATSPFRWAAPLMRLPRVVRQVLGFHRRRIVTGYKQRARITGYCEVYAIPEELLPLLDTCVRASVYDRGAMSPCESVFDVWHRAGLRYSVYGWPSGDMDSLAHASADLCADPKRRYFLHLYETDAFLHAHPRDTAELRAYLRPYAERITELYNAAARQAHDVRLTVFSDHGMTPVDGTRDVMGSVEQLGFRMGRDYVAVYDSTMARFWVRRPRVREPLIRHLRELECGRLLDDEELGRLGIAFADRRFGELIFLMHPGLVIAPSHMGRVPPDGMHGFHPAEDPWADAMVISTAPIPPSIRHITQLYSLMTGTVEEMS